LPRAGNPCLFRKGLYPNQWESELELQSVFRLINRWKAKFRRSLKPASAQKSATAAVLAPAEKLSSPPPGHI
jgi:hypothetical protein